MGMWGKGKLAILHSGVWGGGRGGGENWACGGANCCLELIEPGAGDSPDSGGGPDRL